MVSLNKSELKLLKSKLANFLHPSNIFDTEITFFVSKLFKDNEVKLAQSWKREVIWVTVVVVNLETSKLVKEMQFLNILFKDSTLFVLNPLTFKLVKVEQSENILPMTTTFSVLNLPLFSLTYLFLNGNY